MDNKPKDIILLQEHQPFANPGGYGNGLDYTSKMEYLYGLNLKFQETGFLKEPKYLGINDWTAFYFIGAAWLVPDELAENTTHRFCPDVLGGFGSRYAKRVGLFCPMLRHTIR